MRARGPLRRWNAALKFALAAAVLLSVLLPAAADVTYYFAIPNFTGMPQSELTIQFAGNDVNDITAESNPFGDAGSELDEYDSLTNTTNLTLTGNFPTPAQTTAEVIASIKEMELIQDSLWGAHKTPAALMMGMSLNDGNMNVMQVEAILNGRVKPLDTETDDQTVTQRMEVSVAAGAALTVTLSNANPVGIALYDLSLLTSPTFISGDVLGSIPASSFSALRGIPDGTVLGPGESIMIVLPEPSGFELAALALGVGAAGLLGRRWLSRRRGSGCLDRC